MSSSSNPDKWDEQARELARKVDAQYANWEQEGMQGMTTLAGPRTEATAEFFAQALRDAAEEGRREGLTGAATKVEMSAGVNSLPFAEMLRREADA